MRGLIVSLKWREAIRQANARARAAGGNAFRAMAREMLGDKSQLLLQRCEGQHLQSANGVKQGDPLSAILFCLYLRDVLTTVGVQAEVEVQSFFDDINISGEPTEVMSDLPSGASATPSCEVGPKVNCSGCPSGKRCRQI